MYMLSGRNVEAVTNTKEFLLVDDNNHYMYSELYTSWHTISSQKRLTFYLHIQ